MADRRKEREKKEKKEKKKKNSKIDEGGEILLSEISEKPGTIGKKKKLSRGKKVMIIISSVLAAVMLLIIINPFHILERILYNYDGMTDNLSELGSDGVIDENVVNIALFGLDTRQKGQFTGNTDSIMILSLDAKNKTVKIVSIMRDTFVPITDENGKTTYKKINAAYAKSPQTAIITLNRVFGLDISEYATVNFYGMSEIIDAVGGIDITVTEDELRFKGKTHPNLNGCMDEICKNLGISASKYYIHTAGKHHVNGIQAVAYSRIRACTNTWGTRDDYGRTDRQRYVMEQLFNKALKIDSSEYASFAKTLRPYTKTSLEIKKILNLANSIFGGKPKFLQARLPQNEWQISYSSKAYKNYGSIVYYDLDFGKKVLHAFLYDNITPEEYVEKNGITKNDWFNIAAGKAEEDKGDDTAEKPDAKPDNTATPTDEGGGNATDNTDEQKSDEGGQKPDEGGGEKPDEGGQKPDEGGEEKPDEGDSEENNG